MSNHAQGPFEVSLTPAGAPDEGEGTALGSLTIAKVFHGDLEGTSKGTMLTASSTGTPGSAAYVAVERVNGTLAGKQGSFSLVHRGVMSAVGRDLVITIVPDSGAGELKGISGSMAIAIAEGGAHSYDLSYTLP